jgi:hypothetical protein
MPLGRGVAFCRGTVRLNDCRAELLAVALRWQISGGPPEALVIEILLRLLFRSRNLSSRQGIPTRSRIYVGMFVDNHLGMAGRPHFWKLIV